MKIIHCTILIAQLFNFCWPVSGILMDKNMGDNLIIFTNDYRQNYSFFRLQLMVERFGPVNLNQSIHF